MKNNNVRILFINKCIPNIIILSKKLHIKDEYTKLRNISLTFFQRLNKQCPFFFKIYLQITHKKHLKPPPGHVNGFSINHIHQYNIDQNKQKLFLSDREFKPIHLSNIVKKHRCSIPTCIQHFTI